MSRHSAPRTCSLDLGRGQPLPMAASRQLQGLRSPLVAVNTNSIRLFYYQLSKPESRSMAVAFLVMQCTLAACGEPWGSLNLMSRGREDRLISEVLTLSCSLRLALLAGRLAAASPAVPLKLVAFRAPLVPG